MWLKIRVQLGDIAGSGVVEAKHIHVSVPCLLEKHIEMKAVMPGVLLALNNAEIQSTC